MGLWSNPAYVAFMAASQRCNNPNNPGFKNYGGRGIKFLFDSFEQFIKEVGPRPDNHSLDRINNDKHYERGNVRWATRKEQILNRRPVNRNTTGLSGVTFVKSRKKFLAYYFVNSKAITLYYGLDFFEACCVRKSWESNQDAS